MKQIGCWLLMIMMITFVPTSGTAQDWGNILDQVGDVLGSKDKDKGGSKTLGKLDLSADQLIEGIKQALDKGIHHAVAELGQKDGFWKRPEVTIPLPEGLEKAKSALKAVGQDKLATDFQKSINRAAEEAVPHVTEVLTGALKKMSIADAKKILEGKSSEATDYFRKHTTSELHEKIRPIISKATDDVNVTSCYKKLIEKAGPYLDSYVDENTLDIDQYVTEEATKGLFVMIEQEEKKIRENPEARTTELLEKVFGALR